MRLTNRDWIAWSVAASIIVVGAVYYLESTTTSTVTPVYRITVTPDRG